MRKTHDKKKVFLALTLILLLISALSLMLGAEHISLIDALKDIASGRTSAGSRILRHVRLPRTLAGILAGSALASAGCIIQSVLSNSLASPSTIGVNSGAGLAVAVFSALFPGLSALVPFASLIGAFSYREHEQCSEERTDE